MSASTRIEVPDFSLVVLIGATGSGKSTFAARWFDTYEREPKSAARWYSVGAPI